MPQYTTQEEWGKYHILVLHHTTPPKRSEGGMKSSPHTTQHLVSRRDVRGSVTQHLSIWSWLWEGSTYCVVKHLHGRSEGSTHSHLHSRSDEGEESTPTVTQHVVYLPVVKEVKSLDYVYSVAIHPWNTPPTPSVNLISRHNLTSHSSRTKGVVVETYSPLKHELPGSAPLHPRLARVLRIKLA